MGIDVFSHVGRFKVNDIGICDNTGHNFKTQYLGNILTVFNGVSCSGTSLTEILLCISFHVQEEQIFVFIRLLNVIVDQALDITL